MLPRTATRRTSASLEKENKALKMEISKLKHEIKLYRDRIPGLYYDPAECECEQVGRAECKIHNSWFYDNN